MHRVKQIKGLAIFCFSESIMIKQQKWLGLVADPVIEAIARLEFEDDLRTGVLPGGCWDP